MLVNLDVIIDIDRITTMVVVVMMIIIEIIIMIILLVVPIVGPKLDIYFLMFELNSFELRNFTTLFVAPHVPNAIFVAANAPIG